MDEFNLFFNRLDIGRLTEEQIELIKSYMYYTWDIRQDEINELKEKLKVLQEEVYGIYTKFDRILED